jgi:hypothetical protein
MRTRDARNLAFTRLNRRRQAIVQTGRKKAQMKAGQGVWFRCPTAKRKENAMYGIVMSTPQQFGRRIAVRSVQDLEYLIKEREMLTGQPGRALEFRCGHQMFTYQVTFDGVAFSIARMPPAGSPVKFTMPAREVEQSQFGIAMTEYRLFCEPLEEKASCCYPTTAMAPAQ